MITIRTIVDAYLADASDFRRVEAPWSLKSHSKPILAHFGDMTFKKFCKRRNERVRDYTGLRRALPRKDSTIRRELLLLRAAFNFAEREEMIDHAPKFVLPAAGAPRGRVLSRSGPDGGELGRLMAALAEPRTPRHLRLFVHLALFAGQRKGATLALKWEHVDFDAGKAGVLYFSRTAARETRKKRVDQPIHPALRPMLLEARARARTAHVVEFRGQPVNDVRVAYQALLERARIPHATIHDLRRTAATVVRQGKSLEHAADFIGDTAATTGRVYAKADPMSNLGAMDAIAAALGMADLPPLNGSAQGL